MQLNYEIHCDWILRVILWVIIANFRNKAGWIFLTFREHQISYYSLLEISYLKVVFAMFINGALLVFIYTYSHEDEPAEWIQAASCESRLLLLLQVQSNLLGLFLWPGIISRFIYLSRSHLYGLGNIVAVVNKTFSFGLVHVWQCFDLVDVCVCVWSVCGYTAKFLW